MSMGIAERTLHAVRQMAHPGPGQSLDVSEADAYGISHVAVVNDDGHPHLASFDYLVHLGNGGIYPVTSARAPYRNFRGVVGSTATEC